jgi:hypothetical protein
VVRARDDELFFYLPLEVSVCREPACIETFARSRGGFIGLSRAEDLPMVGEALGEMQIVDEVEGLDLDGRRARAVLFRPQ